MSEPAVASQIVRVLQRIISQEPSGSIITVDPGVFDAAFLCQMLGETVYMQAYADGSLEVIHD